MDAGPTWNAVGANTSLDHKHLRVLGLPESGTDRSSGLIPINCTGMSGICFWKFCQTEENCRWKLYSQPNSDLMAGAPEHRSRFDQDITPRSAGRHGSTGFRPDVSGAQQFPFQEYGTSVNCESDNTSIDWLYKCLVSYLNTFIESVVFTF